ncbi:hypothetical protein BDF14DRAFT_1874459 [Spinellus fusiger]|nr:hypothetical protein BDF14DRAFT_1874459 [Spinellus fusiger]
MPIPTLFEAIRTSCRQCIAKSHVQVSEERARHFLESLDTATFEELSTDSPMRMPLKFSSMAEEINFIAFIDLLNFGSGYRLPLHAAIDRGAFDTIRFGAMSFHIGGTPMTAEKFKDLSAFDISEIFQIPIDRDVHPPDMPFVTMTEATELKPLAASIASVLNTTGEFLKDNHYKDMASFILDTTSPTHGPPSAARLVSALVKALAGFQDTYCVQGQEVLIYKKAQLLVYHLWVFFRDHDPERFDFEDVGALTVFADNVIPTLLVHLGIVTIPQAWKEDIEANRDIGGERATVLRAASIVACERIVQLARSSVGPVSTMKEGDLDIYLWRLGKEEAYRKIPRFEWRDTVMF